MTKLNGYSNSKELFRYARVKAPRILDLESRLKTIPAGKSLIKLNGKEKLAAAKKIAESSSYIDSEKKLSFDYFIPLNIDTVPEDRLPCKSCIKDIDNFQIRTSENIQNIKKDIGNVSQSLFAAVSLREESEIGRLSKLLQFIEIYSSLHKTEKCMHYAPVITKRFSAEKQTNGHDTDVLNSLNSKEDKHNEISSHQVLMLWNAANNYKKEKERQISVSIHEVNKRKFVPKKTGSPTKAKSSAGSDKTINDNTRQFIAFSDLKRKDLAALQQQKEAYRAKKGIEIIPEMIRDKTFTNSNRELKKALSSFSTSTGSTFDLLTDKYPNFCDWYRQTREKESISTSIRQNCDLDINDPCLEKLASQRHALRGSDQVKPLGEADLIVVEENWIEYTPGEISSIETILKNEKRVKIVNTEKTFEEVSEITTEEISEKETETQTTTSNELSSQIEDEINTRFESDINSSVSGSGGGSIGVVDFNGEGSLNTSVGIGLDSSMKSSESSNFSNEIINRALEKTKKTTTERRYSRTFRKYETSHTHEIDNTGTNSNHINGVYCYLDKHICITERQYGIRQFLIADVKYPGNDILMKEMQRQALNLSEVGLPPVFDIEPGGINEFNYLSLVGRYRASNVSTPPPIIKLVSKTYKTDTSNENKEQNESKLKKVADVLVPFFGQYKRFLIQDNIEIPEGYGVQEVHITVTHGSNGVSIPAHLPFSLGGALLYAMPKLMISTLPIYTLFYLPIALTEIVYLASPVLHYNADSSNVTINIGHETQESSYFFFPPDELLVKITNLITGFPQLSENVIEEIKNHLQTFMTDMPTVVSEQLVDGLQGAFNGTVTKLKELIDIIALMAKPLYSGQLLTPAEATTISDFFTTNFQGFIDALTSANINVSNLFQPLQDLIDAIKETIQTELLQAFFDEIKSLSAIFENSDYKTFSNLKGYTNTLPVSLNCIALKPGVTINLTACMVRIEDQSLDAWRMETFDRLNQAYFQLEADYETKLLMKNRSNARYSPGLMRIEEHRVIKDRVIKSLQMLHSSSDNDVLSLEQYKLFEHAIDWDNISYHLYNYGPKGNELVYEKLGLYKGADERRKAFMNALWTQVLIPLKADELLESFMMGYIKTGEVKTLDDLIDNDAQPDGEIDEIAAIYRDIILRRQKLMEEPVETHRREVVPTEFMIIYEGNEQIDLPVNEIALTNCNGS